MQTIEEQKVDTILGVLYKHSDASDEPAQTWLDGDKFHTVAQQILSALQAKFEMAPPLQQADVSRRSEQVCLHPREHRSYIGEGYLRCNICGEEMR